ncbi:MAG: MFS transporter [Chloroflexi bacterium]|nr:MAG: MFS transporter [Chloroflexota bacterium]
MLNALAGWRQTFPPHRILWIAGLGVALSLLGDVSLYVVLPTHVDEAGIVLANVGLMLSANRLIRIVINSPFGVFIERIPRRRMAVPALFLGAFSSLLYSIPGFWPLLIGRLLWGTAWAGLWLSASTMALDISTHDNRGRFVGLLQMWYFIGIGISSLLGGVLTDWLSYLDTFRISFVITLIAAVGWWLFLPETQHHRAEGNHPQPAAPSAAGYIAETGYVLPLLTALLLMGVNWLIFLGILGAVLPLLLEERIGETVLLAGIVIPLATFTGAVTAGNQVVSLLSSPLAGWLTDRSRQRWGLILLALLTGGGAMAMIAVGGGVIVVTATMLGAAATSVLQTQVMTLIGDFSSAHRRGRVLGILNTVGDVGSAGGPLLAYALLPVIELEGIFWLAAIVLLLSIPWTLWIARRESAVHPVAARGEKVGG